MLRKLIPQSTYARNVITLMTGTAAAQAIPIAITPILTRLYKPEDFGVLAIFMAIATTLGSISNGRYELAIMLPDEDENALNIAAAGVLIALIFSFGLFAAVFFFGERIQYLLNDDAIGPWLYFVPFVVLMTGIYNVLNYLNTRKKLYKDIAITNFYKATTMASIQLGFGLIKNGAAGLLIGQICSQVASNYRITKNVKEYYNFEQINFGKIKKLVLRYKNFPLFSLWAVLANSLTYNLTNILISAYYSVATLGFYSLAQRMLSVPTSIIGSSIGQVYFQEASREKIETGSAIKTFDKTTKKLFFIAIILFAPLYFLLPFIFSLAFGDNWQIAGEYGQITLPFVAAQFIVSAVSTTNSIFERQIISLAWQVSLLASSLLLIFFSNHLGLTFFKFLYCLSAGLTVHYVFLWFLLRRVAAGYRETHSESESAS